MNNLNTALYYAANGIPVFPCGLDKKPYTKHGYKDATTDEQQIRAWWTRSPEALIGMPTGAPSGLWVLDVDTPKKEGEANGLDSLQALLAQYGPLPPTYTDQSARGGYHFFFRSPNGVVIKCSTSKLALKIDVLGDGGYIIMADGSTYLNIDSSPVADAPDWLLNLVVSMPPTGGSSISTVSEPQTMFPIITRPYAQKALDDECGLVASAIEGARNNTLNKAAFALGTLIGGGELDEGVVLARLSEASARCGLLPDEYMNTITSGVNAGKEHPREAPERATQGDASAAGQITEERIAAAFAAKYKDTLRYCGTLGTWFEWQPELHVWKRDEKNRAFHYAREACKALNPDGKPSLGRASTAFGVERFAKADPQLSTTEDQWDSHPLLLGTPNGVISLSIKEYQNV